MPKVWDRLWICPARYGVSPLKLLLNDSHGLPFVSCGY